MDARLFLEALEEPWREDIAGDPGLEEWLAGCLRDARDAWPGARPCPGFVRYLASKVPTLRMAAAYVTLRSRELFLMYACIHGDPRALAEFEKGYLPAVARALERMKWAPPDIEEAMTQSVVGAELREPAATPTPMREERICPCGQQSGRETARAKTPAVRAAAERNQSC